MWNVTLEYTATHFNVFCNTRLGDPSPIFHTSTNAQLYDAVVVSRKLGRKYRTKRVLKPGTVYESITLSARPQLLTTSFDVLLEIKLYLYNIWLYHIVFLYIFQIKTTED